MRLNASLVLLLMVISISLCLREQENCCPILTPPLKLLHFTVICMGRTTLTRSAFQGQVPLIKSPVTSGLLYQPHISTPRPPPTKKARREEMGAHRIMATYTTHISLFCVSQ